MDAEYNVDRARLVPKPETKKIIGIDPAALDGGRSTQVTVFHYQTGDMSLKLTQFPDQSLRLDASYSAEEKQAVWDLSYAQVSANHHKLLEYVAPAVVDLFVGNGSFAGVHPKVGEFIDRGLMNE